MFVAQINSNTPKLTCVCLLTSKLVPYTKTILIFNKQIIVHIHSDEFRTLMTYPKYYLMIRSIDLAIPRNRFYSINRYEQEATTQEKYVLIRNVIDAFYLFRYLSQCLLF